MEAMTDQPSEAQRVPPVASVVSPITGEGADVWLFQSVRVATFDDPLEAFEMERLLNGEAATWESMWNGQLPCGHHDSLLVKSVESDASWCALCDARSRLRDAVTMEEHYKQENAALRSRPQIAAGHRGCIRLCGHANNHEYRRCRRCGHRVAAEDVHHFVRYDEETGLIEDDPACHCETPQVDGVLARPQLDDAMIDRMAADVVATLFKLSHRHDGNCMSGCWRIRPSQAEQYRAAVSAIRAVIEGGGR